MSMEKYKGNVKEKLENKASKQLHGVDDYLKSSQNLMKSEYLDRKHEENKVQNHDNINLHYGNSGIRKDSYSEIKTTAA